MRSISLFLLWCYVCTDVSLGERGVKGGAKRHKTQEETRIQYRQQNRRLTYYYAAINKQKAAAAHQGGGGRVRDPYAVLPGRIAGTVEKATRFPTGSPTWSPTRSPTRSPTKSPIAFELPVDEFGNPGVYEDPHGEMDDPELEDHLGGNGPSLPEVTEGGSEFLLDGLSDQAFGPLFNGRSSKKIKGDAKSLRNAVIDSYTIGNKRLYGLTTGLGEELYISELYYGGIYKVNLTSAMVDNLVPSFEFFQRPSAGLTYTRNTIFVAGLGPAFGVDASIHVYDADSGDHIVTCNTPFSTGMILDVTIVGNIAYATDAVLNQIVVMDVDDAIHGICNMTSLFLPFNDFLSDEIGVAEFGTGIIGFEDGLIITNYAVNGVFYHDFEYDVTTQFLFQADLPSRPVGVAIHGEKYLFVSHEDSTISAWKLRKRGDGEVKAQDKGIFQTDFLDGPRSLAFVGMNLFAVNSNLTRLAFPDEGEGYSEQYDETFDLVVVMI